MTAALPPSIKNDHEVTPYFSPMVRLRVPGSKSYTNRALLIAALARGVSLLKNILLSDDTRYMIRALRKLGVRFRQRNNNIIVEGRNGILKRPKRPLFAGNAGTTMRFLAAALAIQSFPSIVTGDARMQKRPIGDLLKALSKLGVKTASLKKNACPPIHIKGPLLGGHAIISAHISSQFLSGLLMASPYTKKPVTLRVKGNFVSKPYVDMTLSIMESFGGKIQTKPSRTFHITPHQYAARTYEVEGDASSASYFWGLAALTGKTIVVENIPADSKQADLQFLEILKMMGCKVQKTKSRGIMVSRSAGRMSLALARPHSLPLVCIGTKSLSKFPDAALTVATLCAFAKGKSRLIGLRNLRVKECDRIHAMKTELQKLGVKIRELRDGWSIEGNPLLLKNPLFTQKPITIETYHDHRIAMCFGMLKPFFPKLAIQNPSCVSKSYPMFWKELRRIQKVLKLPIQKTNVILTGMRGSGKSTLGKLLAKQFDWKFIDLDHFIEKHEKKSIAEIVREKGWSYFRRKERKAVKHFAKLNHVVLAIGGGTMMDPKNATLLKRKGFVIFLNVPIALLQKRLKHDYPRPSLAGENSWKELPLVWKQRKERYYAIADYILSI